MRHDAELSLKERAVRERPKTVPAPVAQGIEQSPCGGRGGKFKSCRGAWRRRGARLSSRHGPPPVAAGPPETPRSSPSRRPRRLGVAGNGSRESPPSRGRRGRRRSEPSRLPCGLCCAETMSPEPWPAATFQDPVPILCDRQRGLDDEKGGSTTSSSRMTTEQKTTQTGTSLDAMCSREPPGRGAKSAPTRGAAARSASGISAWRRCAPARRPEKTAPAQIGRRDQQQPCRGYVARARR